MFASLITINDKIAYTKKEKEIRKRVAKAAEEINKIHNDKNVNDYLNKGHIEIIQITSKNRHKLE